MDCCFPGGIISQLLLRWRICFLPIQILGSSFIILPLFVENAVKTNKLFSSVGAGANGRSVNSFVGLQTTIARMTSPLRGTNNCEATLMGAFNQDGVRVPIVCPLYATLNFSGATHHRGIFTGCSFEPRRLVHDLQKRFEFRRCASRNYVLTCTVIKRSLAHKTRKIK